MVPTLTDVQETKLIPRALWHITLTTTHRHIIWKTKSPYTTILRPTMYVQGGRYTPLCYLPSPLIVPIAK